MEKAIAMAILITVAEELNKVLALNPAIESSKEEADREKLMMDLTEAAGLIEVTDIISDESIKVLTELGLWKFAPIKDDEAGTEEVTLIQQVEDATELKELRLMVKNEPEFESLRKTLNIYKEVEGLRGAMLSIIEPKSPAKEKAAPVKEDKKEKTEKAPAKDKAKTEKVKGAPGVIATIVAIVEKADKKKGVSKEEILDQLVAAFPDKAKGSMKNTINVQVPARINKERWSVGKTADGKYFKA